MADDPQSRFEEGLTLDPRIEGEERQALAGTTRAGMYDADAALEDEVTVPPDGRPMAEQPRWRRDFSIDWPRDHHVARREFSKFLVLTSGAFVVGQGWIAAKSLVRRRRPPPPRVRIASARDLAPGGALMFAYPGEHDPCLLVRLPDGSLVAYSQKCTHLSCAVVPEVDKGILRCPCHEGIFDLATGRNIAGPPPRPLPRIEIAVEGDEIYAVGLQARTV
jgi:nitrite reductase/ring-hydroxylating ferredoxin subunit